MAKGPESGKEAGNRFVEARNAFLTIAAVGLLGLLVSPVAEVVLFTGLAGAGASQLGAQATKK
jgi:hypothetical protein